VRELRNQDFARWRGKVMRRFGSCFNSSKIKSETNEWENDSNIIHLNTPSLIDVSGGSGERGKLLSSSSRAVEKSGKNIASRIENDLRKQKLKLKINSTSSN
jgi:hypothetical protein